VRALVVEDDAPCRVVLEKWLRRHGHDVRWAATGGAAITMLENEPFDVLLLDLNLGHGQSTGWDVARFKWAVPRLRNIPIVVITGLSAEEVHAGATQNVLEGQQLILPKPLSGQNMKLLTDFMASLEKKPKAGG
jgi:CheY-like chemotaxis protein